MSFDRPGVDDDLPVSDTEMNEALENGELEDGGLNTRKVEHEDGQRSPGPERAETRRTPDAADVTPGDSGQPVEPPD